MNFQNLGLISYSEARLKQNTLLTQRVAGAIGDTIIFCEHSPTITLGKNSSLADLHFPAQYYQERKIEVVQTDRGGGITYHGPGQLMLYPVISLKEKGIGVKRFVAEMLRAIAESISLPDSSVELSILQDGIFIDQKKIVFCGLRIIRGVSNHGFSININCDLKNFESFLPCRDENLRVSSLEREGCNLMINKLRDELHVGAGLRARPNNAPI